MRHRALGEFHFHHLFFAFANVCEVYFIAGLFRANERLKLLRVDDELVIQLRDHIIHLQSRLSCRAVLGHVRDGHAHAGGKVQLLARNWRNHIHRHAEVRALRRALDGDALAGRLRFLLVVILGHHRCSQQQAGQNEVHRLFGSFHFIVEDRV